MERPFPCPFCHSAGVVLVGEGRHFQHYRCVDCAEVWTAQADAPLGRARGSVARAAVPRSVDGEVLRRQTNLPNATRPAGPFRSILDLLSQFETEH